MDHLNEVPGAVGSAAQIAKLRCTTKFFASRRSLNVTETGRQGSKDGIEMFHNCKLRANHHAIAALQAPDAAARSNIHIVNLLWSKLFGAPDIIHIIGISAIDEDVLRLEQRHEIGNGLVNHARWNH